ncbi:helix-turn-helix transcriptional regulator [Collimonas sp. PA-H2]|uniref:helix-turn-helix domain-containing protein n=1 Tax=Collimonas sp. PA-H2 TaxID=1881062 RepID=UPI000BF89A88|nr:helix-turn-helix transcriptional regulator [Collimonas sp. PA-H2]
MKNKRELLEGDPTTLADFLRAVRKQQKGGNGKPLTLTAIHNRCGLPIPILSKLEAGQILDPRSSTLKSMLHGYGLAFEDVARYLPLRANNKMQRVIVK